MSFSIVVMMSWCEMTSLSVLGRYFSTKGSAAVFEEDEDEYDDVDDDVDDMDDADDGEDVDDDEEVVAVVIVEMGGEDGDEGVVVFAVVEDIAEDCRFRIGGSVKLGDVGGSLGLWGFM